MRKIFYTFVCSCLFASAETLYITDDDVPIYSPKNYQKIGVIARGISGEKIKEDDQWVVLKIQGFQKKDDEKTLYATNGKELPAILFDKENNGTTLEVAIPKDKVSQDQSKIWQDGRMLYENTCSTCHSTHSPKEYSALEWESIFSTMRLFSMPTDNEAKKILEYLKSHANDGYATDESDTATEENTGVSASEATGGNPGANASKIPGAGQ